MAYGKLEVPAFTPVDPAKTQSGYFSMINQNMSGAIDTTKQLNEANQAELTRALGQAFGGSFSDTWKSGMSTLKAQVEGKFTDEQKSMFASMSAAKAGQLGLGAAPASINVSMQGFGNRMIQSQQEALRMMPSFMTAAKQNLMATPTRVESMFIPISQYASQRAADNISQWRAQYAQAQATHQSQMAAETLRRQEEQASAAQSMATKRENLATHNAVAMQNAANYRAGIQGGRSNALGALSSPSNAWNLRSASSSGYRNAPASSRSSSSGSSSSGKKPKKQKGLVAHRMSGTKENPLTPEEFDRIETAGRKNY